VGAISLIELPIVPAVLIPDNTSVSQIDASTQVWFVLLGMACTVRASMVGLVFIEAVVPVGTVPPPLVGAADCGRGWPAPDGTGSSSSSGYAMS
jgi:hypothetical protein